MANGNKLTSVAAGLCVVPNDVLGVELHPVFPGGAPSPAKGSPTMARLEGIVPRGGGVAWFSRGHVPGPI